LAKRKKYNKKLYFIIAVASLVIVLAFAFIFRRPIIYYSKIVYHKVFLKGNKQQAFISRPTNLNGEIFVPDAEVFGIDISRHQGFINWNKLAKFKFSYHRIDFVYIKATESDYWSDNSFQRNWDKAKKKGFYRGAYHFFDPQKNAQEQMNKFFDIVHLQSGDLPPMLDVEKESTLSTKEYRKRALNCLLLMQQHYHIKPILYINQNFYKAYFSSPEFDNYPLWISRLSKKMPKQKNWVFWQFTHTAIVSGIDEFVDLNAFNGSALDFKLLLKP